MKRRIKKDIVLILLGVAIVAIPFLLRMKEQERSNRYMKAFEEEQNEEKQNKKDHKKKDSLLLQEGVIGIIEIPSLDIKYPVFEGAGSVQLNEGIGHMTNTTELCGKGNCVLAGHNGSRRGVYFTYLCNIEAGAKVVLTNRKKEKHEYTVKEMKVVNPYDEWVTEQTEEESLTLFTCAEHGTKRFVVKCEQVNNADQQDGEKADVVIMDPPRSGSNEAFLSAVCRLSPNRIVYISCGPQSLARDLDYLTAHGYRTERIQPVDLFPMTVHVESIVLLSHKSPDSHIDVKVEFGEGEEKVPLDKIAERAKQYQPAPRVTYKMIQEYIEEKYGFKVHTAYIAEVKRNLGLPMYDAPNMVEELKQPRRHSTAEKVEAIKDALKHFGVI